MKLVRAASLLLTFTLFCTALPASAQRRAARQSAPPRDDIERRIDALVARMTVEEKLGQLQQLGGDVAGKPEGALLGLARRGALGSTLGVRGARNTNELQRAALDGSRLKIPLIFGF